MLKTSRHSNSSLGYRSICAALGITGIHLFCCATMGAQSTLKLSLG